jgi:hypothetical protein
MAKVNAVNPREHRLVCLLFLVLGTHLLGTAPCECTETQQPAGLPQAKHDWRYLDNGIVRVGLDLRAGGSVGWFSRTGSENVLNTYDKGRYLQQSYYGSTDGSLWSKQPWRYNPVQGGGWKGEPAEVLDFRMPSTTSAYTRTIPRHWATGLPTPEMAMEQWTELDGAFVRIRCRAQYRGETTHTPQHQEMPALFVHPAYDTLVTVPTVGGALDRRQPGFPNESARTPEAWAAWERADGEAVGLFFPHADQITAYRYRERSGKSDCSYFAPIRTETLRPGTTLEYTVTLGLGTAPDLRSAFLKREKETPRPERNNR